MTKKPSEKNKAWEKDRRDRLNKTFEELAKLLPKYDPSITWSKIEIIQKSILHIKELHERHENYLRDKDPEKLNQHSDLIDALNYYQSRNGQLADLLRKAKITLPPFKLPKFLTDNPQHQQFKNGHKKSKRHTTPTSSPATPIDIKSKSTVDKNEECLNSDKTVENKIDNSLIEKEKEINNSINDTDNTQTNASNDQNDSVNHVTSVQSIIKLSTQNHQESIDQTLDHLQVNNVTQQKAIITTGILVPLVPLQTLQTTNPTPNITIPLPPPSSSTQHITEISLPTTTITNPFPGQLSKSSNSSLALPLSQSSATQSTTATTFIKLPTTTTALNSLTLQKLANRLIIQNPKRVYRKIARDKDGKIKILPQPRLKIYFQRSDGKVPIPVLKRSNNIPIMKRKRRRQKRKASTSIIENTDDRNMMTTTITDECKNDNKKQKLEEQNDENEITNIKDIIEKNDPIEVKVEKSVENNINDNNDVLKTNQTEKTENLKITEDKFNDSNQMNINEEKIDEIDECLKVTEHVEENNSNHASINNEKSIAENGSVSPTAAFLLSFPVVTTMSTTTTTTTTTTTAITTESIDEKSMNLENSKSIDVKEKSDHDLNGSSTEKFGENEQKMIVDAENSKQHPMEIDEPDSNSICEEIGKVYPLIPVTTENQSVTVYTTVSDNFHQNFDTEIQTSRSNCSISSNDQCQEMKIESVSNCSTVSVATANESLLQNASSNTVPVSSTFSPVVTSLYNVMPICAPLPLQTSIGNHIAAFTTSTMSSIVNSTLPDNLPLEPLTNSNCKSSTSAVYPDAMASSYLKNTNTSIVETTWCSLTTIPSVETVQKSSDNSVLPTNMNSNQNVNTFGLGGAPQIVPITTINSNPQINTQSMTLNSQSNTNPSAFVPSINIQPNTVEIPKFQLSKVAFTTASTTKTTTPRATTSRRQNSRTASKQNTPAITTTSLSQPPQHTISVSSSNVSQQNLSTNVVSSVSTAFSSIPASNQFYPNNLQMNPNSMPHPSYSEPLPHGAIFNQNPPIITNPYSNFPVPNSFSPINTVNDTLQNYSRTATNQLLKQPGIDKNLIPISQSISEGINSLASSKSENNLINTSKNNINYGSQSKFSNTSFIPPVKYENVPQVSQMNVPQSRSENITSIPQSKPENFGYTSQPKFENSNFLPQSKSNNFISNSESKANSTVTYVPQSRSSGIPYSSELPIVSDNDKISNAFCSQPQIFTSTNPSHNYLKPLNTFSNTTSTTSVSTTTATSVFHSYSNTTKHSQMYSPYHLPLNSSITAPSTVTEFYPPSALNFQTSSIPNLPSNCAPIYPTAVTNTATGDFISSLYVPNTFSRPPLTNSLPVYPIAKSTSASPQMIQNTFAPTSSSTNRLPTYSSNNVSSTAFTIPPNTAPSTTSLYLSQPTTFQKNNTSPFHYPIAPSSTIIPNYLPPNTTTNTMTSGIPLKQMTYITSPATLSSVYYPPLPTSVSNVSNPNYSTTNSNLTSTINSKQPLKTVPSSVPSSQNNVQSVNIKDNSSSSTSNTSNSTTKQMSSFKSYQPKAQTNSQRNYAKQNNSNTASNVNTSMALPPSSEHFTSQNNTVPKTTTEVSYSQNTMSNSSNLPSSYNVTPSASTSAIQSKPKTPSGIDPGPTYPQTTSGYNSRSALNYPPPSITPLPPPLLSTSLPVSNSSSLSNFHQNTFMEPPIDTLKYSTQSSTAPVQSYNRISQDSLSTAQSKSFNSRPMDSFISTVPTTPIYTHASQTNLGYCTPNAFYPCGSDAIYSPAKNYYYHPLQDTSNFSFSLTSTTNSLPTVSSNNPPVTVAAQSYATPSSVKNEVAWMPPPRPSSVAPSFTFSLTPTTMTTSTSIVNSSTNNNTISRSTTQKTTKSTTNSKSKTNYNNMNSSEVPKSTANKVQLPVTSNTAVSSNLATNFTFSLTNSKASFTNTESPIYGKPVNISNDFPQQKQQIGGYDRYNTVTADQHKQNTPATNFSFALTKTTTASSNSSATGNSAQRSMSSTSSVPSSSSSTSAITTNSSSFSIDATLNQPNCYTAQNMNNSKVNSLTSTDQTHNSGVFKKPLAEPPPSVKRSVTPLSNQGSTQNYYNAYDQKLQRPPQPSTPALHQKAPVNWIAPSEFGAPPLMDYGCVPSYPPTQLPPQNFEYNNRKNDLYYHPSFTGSDDHFPSWSPNKMIDTTSHFAGAPAGFGNYYGEIPPFSGGGNNNNFFASTIPTSDTNKSSYTSATSSNKTPSTAEKDFKNSRASTPSCNQNSNNFFSVSQLVDQETTTASNTSQKAYENCSTNSGNSISSSGNNNSNNSTSNKKVSSSASKSKDSNKKFGANNTVTYPSTATEQQQRSNVNAPTNVSNVDNMTANTSNNYSTEALLTKKEKTIRNYTNVNNPDYYGGMNTPSNTLYPPSSAAAPPPPPLSSSLIVDNMDPNYFYNYPTNAGGCLPDTDYLGSIYPNDINYSRSPSIKPSIRKLSSSTSSVPPPPSPQPHPHPHHPSIPHHPPPSNFVPYDTANYYPVPLGVNSPLMPGPTAAHHHTTTDPYGSSGTLVMPPTAVTPHPYIHTSSGNYQSHTWNPKVHNTPTANSLHHQYQNLQESQLGHNQSQQHHQHPQHLFPSEMNVNPSNTNNSNNNRITAHNQHQQQQQQQQQQNHNHSDGLVNTSTTGTAGAGAVTASGNQNATATGNNLTNFNLTTICPEINNEKVGSNPW